MTDDLIFKKELLDWLTNPTGFRTYCKNCCGIDCLNCLIGEAIKNAPTVDAVPVRRGKWEFNGISVACSECGSNKPTKAQDHKLATQEIRFCYYCGADMREDERETN